MNQAAREPASAPAARSVLKYRSSVLTAAFRTRLQSEQVSRWRLISPSTDWESRPSKYQQIKWIVSLQLISPVPQIPKSRVFGFPRTCISRAKHRLPAENLICRQIKGLAGGGMNSRRRACDNS